MTTNEAMAWVTKRGGCIGETTDRYTIWARLPHEKRFRPVRSLSTEDQMFAFLSAVYGHAVAKAYDNAIGAWIYG